VIAGHKTFLEHADIRLWLEKNLPTILLALDGLFQQGSLVV